MTIGSSGPPGLATAKLTPIVRALLNEPAAVVMIGSSVHSLGGGASEGMGLFKVTGSAQVGGGTVPWALVCKVCAPAQGMGGSAWEFQQREPLAYQSGVLAALPGAITAPRCLAVEPQPDGSTRLWLEAIEDVHPGPWSCDRFAQVARQLGSFNGAYLTGTPLPEQRWLSRQWLRDFIAPSGPALAELELVTGSEAQPLLRKLYPPSVVAELRMLWAERDRFLTALEMLPRTFCHHDAFRRNFLHRAVRNGEELVAIDWAYAGLGAIGEDLGQLVVASLYFFEAEGIKPRDLAEACFTEYLAGMRDQGWAGDERDVRMGFTIAAALRHTLGLLRVICPLVADPARRSVVEDRFGRPLEEVVEAWYELWPLQFELAEEARSMLLAAG